MADSPFHIIVDSSPASDSWGFVGRVMVAEHECFRTLRAFSTPGEAQSAAQVLVSDVLGEMVRILRRKARQPRLQLRYVEDRGAGHNEAAWAGRFERAIRWLLPRKRGDLNW